MIFGIYIGLYTLVLLLAVHIAIVSALSWWIYHDAEKRDRKPLLWALLAFLFGFIAIAVWLYVRPRSKDG